MTQPTTTLPKHSLLLALAKQYGTPAYVYDKNCILNNLTAYQAAFKHRRHQICYAVKANSNLHILKLLAAAGAGFDIVSIGELQRVIMAGGDPKKTIFSGVGKQLEEIIMALDIGIEAFDIESLPELDTIIQAAEATETIAPISIRFNPNVDAKTHPYISTGLKESKFGLTESQATLAYQRAKDSPWINIVGINMHIGSQITDIDAFANALSEQAAFVKHLTHTLDIKLQHINIGGGIGVCYQDEQPIALDAFAQLVSSTYPDPNITLIMEPGRSIVANAGVLLTEVLYVKSHQDQHFTIVDAGMNDYIRTALYQAYNQISNLGALSDCTIDDYTADDYTADSQQTIPPDTATQQPIEQQPMEQAIVGPVCESGDFFAKKRRLKSQAGDILAIHDVGAYGFVMASNYNTRMRPAEILIDGDEATLIRRRETFEAVIAPELIGDLALESEYDDATHDGLYHETYHD
ncbi:diaminopimelate decarboxylase [Ostreibacterium oceani]|uniref:Diaminopimelate decarboxylase n=1 Tax=Ostreibacterium oceani TaxID=2654998 RepID=A0A6N7F234_9GAMM|nr:diaminopimelate decarboxylase [Ostreibacterium oceani]MPV85926.1 diaminopimelate decarboxylase [Ostreibacterium oceani]